jgi:hypothetical protein
MFKKTTILSVLVVGAILVAAGSLSAGTFWLRVGEGRVTARLDRVPLRVVLDRISQEAGVAVEVEKGLDGPVSARILGMPLEEGLKRILSGYSSSMVFSKVDSGTDKGNFILSELKVFGKGKKGESQFESIGGPSPLPRKSSPGAAGISAGEELLGRKNRAEIGRLQREIATMEKSLAQSKDRRKSAGFSAAIARKSAEIERLKAWALDRQYGMERMERLALRR